MAKKKPAADAPPPDDAPAREYTVVARRYRPQQFGELVGQEAVSKAITHAIQSDRVAHAYLFTGARGVGKTSAARILAKALNCVTGPTVSPCGVCDACVAITSGEDIDVLEIDGASNNGVDEVRTIRNNVATRPSRSRYKIYIIDEVHMLSKPAFNALLKTLEEPPPHVKFIFATTEVNKIPITILSRCQRFDFPSITTARIFEHLKKVMIGEGRQADDDALRLIARRAAGSMRDAQSLLEQMLSAADGPLSAAVVNGVLGTAAGERVVEIAAAILGKDPGRALGLVAKCADDGLQLGEVLDQLIDYWRALMLLSCTGGALEELDLPEAHHDAVRKQAAAATLDTILAGLDVLATTKARLKATNHGQVLLEMAVVRLGRMDDLIPLTQLVQWVSQGGGTAVAAGTPRPATASGGDPSKKNGQLTLAESFRAGNLPAPTAPELGNGLLTISDATVADVWAKVRAEAGVMLGAELDKAGVPAIAGPKMLMLRFPARYNHAYEFCKDSGRTGVVEGVLKKLTGVPWGVRFEIDAGAGPGQATPAPGQSAKDREKLALQNPLLTAILTRLEGRLLKMDGDFAHAPADAAPAPEETP